MVTKKKQKVYLTVELLSRIERNSTAIGKLAESGNVQARRVVGFYADWLAAPTRDDYKSALASAYLKLEVQKLF